MGWQITVTCYGYGLTKFVNSVKDALLAMSAHWQINLQRIYFVGYVAGQARRMVNVYSILAGINNTS